MNDKTINNMKKVLSFTQMLFMVLIGLAFGACSSGLSELEQNSIQNGKHTIKMNFIGKIEGFEQSSAATRATSSDWHDGDSIYITFNNGSELIPALAIYDETTGWSISYDGYLATGENLKCEARYFVNAKSLSPSLVYLNSNSVIYEDLNATYIYKNNALTVTATLTPKTGRLRFAGNVGEEFTVRGVTAYSVFSSTQNTYSTDSDMIRLKVGDDGYTPYIYGTFADEERTLGLIGSNYAYTRDCSSEILKAGESGYMSIPSEASHYNWIRGLSVKASGVKFRMLPVAGYSGGFFLMAETETTEALYNSVIKGTASPSQLPVSNVGIDLGYFFLFISNLCKETKLDFKLPTEEQWLYAAKGGEKTQNYIYAGSDILTDVAWYSGNSSSTKHPVKSKAPNELGLYDMSGNVGELTSSVSNYRRTYCGGSYACGASSCTSSSTSYIYTDSEREDVGFRLILTVK